MEPNLDQIRAVLERTPRAIRELLDGLPEAWLSASEGPNTFTPRDVVGHLIQGEKTDWIPRARIILNEGESRAFEPFDRMGGEGIVRSTAMPELLTRFEALRVDNLKALDTLAITAEQLSLKGRHPALGVVTLGQLLATWAVHDLNHIGQIVRVMSRSYDSTVGPWKAYLGILNR